MGREIAPAQAQCLRHRAPQGLLDETERVGHLSRQAHLYVFAWHGGSDERADQRDPEQWRFFVAAESDLPRNQKSIGLARFEKLAAPCGIAELRQAVEKTHLPTSGTG